VRHPWLALAAVLLSLSAHAHPDHHHPQGPTLALKVQGAQMHGSVSLPPAALQADLSRVPDAPQQRALLQRAAQLIGQLEIHIDGQPHPAVLDTVALIVRIPPVALRQLTPVRGVSIHPGPTPSLQLDFQVAATPSERLSLRWPVAALFAPHDAPMTGHLQLADGPHPFELTAQTRYQWTAPGVPTHERPRPYTAVGLITLVGLGLMWLVRRRRRAVVVAVCLATGCAAWSAWNYDPAPVEQAP
jgi:hypothetical protein